MSGDRKLDSRKLAIAVDAGAPTFVEDLTSTTGSVAASTSVSSNTLYMLQAFDGAGFYVLDTGSETEDPLLAGVYIGTGERHTVMLDNIRSTILFQAGGGGSATLRVFTLK